MNQIPFDISSSSIPLLSAEQIKAAMRELEWCIDELVTFDPVSVSDRDDPRIDALEAAIDDALSGLFDKKSKDFNRFRCESLVDNACFSLAYPTPIHEVRQGLEAGLADQAGRLRQVLAALHGSLDMFHADRLSTPGPEPRPAAPPLSAPAAAPPPSTATGYPGLGSRSVVILNSGDTEQLSALVDFVAMIDMIPRPMRSNARDPGQHLTLEGIADAEFAVVIVTPDDIRTLNDPHTSPDFQPCPSQEILFGMGCLIGALGSHRVCALVVDDVAIDLDSFGLHVTPMDRAEGWKLDLAKMIKSAGVQIDLNRAI